MKRQRRPIPTTVRATIDELVRSARSARNDNNSVEAWRCLEDAHVLSQPWVRPHVRVHLAMLSLGWAQRDRREIPGQLLRLVLAGPGTTTPIKPNPTHTRPAPAQSARANRDRGNEESEQIRHVTFL